MMQEKQFEYRFKFPADNTDEEEMPNIGVFLYLLATASVLSLTGCNGSQKAANSPSSQIFTSSAPQNGAFKTELQYLELTDRLSPGERAVIEKELSEVEKALGVPKPLLWCVLFQESRFDSFKNATTKMPAKGLGQFKITALNEINYDTNHFDSRTGRALSSLLSPRSLPIDFKLKTKPKINRGHKRKSLPPQAVTSYFHTPTAVMASGAYLNNRYHQLKTALDHQKISYDPQILWLFAAAAYNKGSRSIFLLLTHEYMSRGEHALNDLLQNPRATYALLTHFERLDYPLRELWSKKVRARYIAELLKNTEAIYSCSMSEHSI